MNDSLVLTTGLALTRNDAVLPFPGDASDDDLREVMGYVLRALGDRDWSVYEVEKLSASMRAYLVERGLMTPGFSRVRGEGRGLAVYVNGQASVEINGTDHLRILGSRGGDDLSELWLILDALDNQLEKEMTYAFDERWGYLTARPGDAGTGARAYLTLHLPALAVTGRVETLALQLIPQGLGLTPLWGGAGGLFQVFNKWCLGTPESRLAETVIVASHHLAEKEKTVRKQLMRDHLVWVKDHVGRALGVAQNVWTVNINEALNLISAVQVGMEMGLVEAGDMTLQSAFSLMRRIQPGHLVIEEMRSTLAGLDDPRIDEARACILREALAEARMR